MESYCMDFWCTRKWLGGSHIKVLLKDDVWQNHIPVPSLRTVAKLVISNVLSIWLN